MNIKQKNLLFSAFVAVTISIIYLLIIKIATPFLGNDEIIMRSIVSGQYTGTPDAHMVFIMYPLGILLKLFYTIFPAFSWYGIFMTLVHWLVWFYLVNRISHFFSSFINKLLAAFSVMLLLIIIDGKYISCHQFTILAGITTGVGIFALICGFVYHKKTDYIFSALFFTLALWIRNWVFFLGIPLILLTVAFFVLSSLKNKKTIHKDLILFPCYIVLLIVISYLIEYFAYSSPEWKAYKEYNSIRSTVLDYDDGIPYFEQVSQICEKYGITAEEYVAFSKYNLIFSDKFSAEFMHDLADFKKNNHSSVTDENAIAELIQSFREEVHKSLLQPIESLGLIMLALILLLSIKKHQLLLIPVELASVLYKFVFMIYYIYRGRFPERLSYSFYFLMLTFNMGILVFLLKEVNISFRKTVTFEIASLCFFGILLITFGKSNMLESRRTCREWQNCIEENNAVSSFFASHGNMVFYIPTSACDHLSDYLLKSEHYEKNGIYLPFWTAKSPLLNNKLADFGIKDLSVALLNYDNVFFAQRNFESTQWLEEYYSSLGKNVSVEIYDSVGTIQFLKINEKGSD